MRRYRTLRFCSFLLIVAAALSACGSASSYEEQIAVSVPASETVPVPEADSVPVPEPESEPEPVISTLHFTASGDNLIHDGLYLQAQKRAGGAGYDFTRLYENIMPFIRENDINWINQETLITDEIPPSNYPCFCTPAAMGHTLYDAGWRVFAMSNNHAYDKGASGVSATRRFWAQMPDDVVTTGLFAGPDDYASIPVQVTEDGIRIAYLAYTEHTNGLPTPADAEANVIYTSEEDVISQQISLAREQADFVFVGVHWGVEGTHATTDAQHVLAQKLADWGADLIIGTGPHVVQPIEMKISALNGNRVPVVYSLGNFVSLQSDASNLIGITLALDIVKTTYPDGRVEKALENIHAVPTVMHYNAGYSDGRVYLFRDYTDELAAQHGVQARYPGFGRDYIQKVLMENIDAQYLMLD